MQTMTLFTDGGARGNPGPSGIGYVLVDEKNEEVFAKSRFLGVGTNNTAEYWALIDGLSAVKKYQESAKEELVLTIKLDSELVVRQLNGIYKVKHPDLKPLYERVQALRASDFPKAVFLHVRREENARADELANIAMDTGKDNAVKKERIDKLQ